MTGRLIAVNVGRATDASWAGAADKRSGIDKRPAVGRVRITEQGVDGDFIGDSAHHGGVDKAVYAFAREDALWWERELNRELPAGRFGENFTTEGLDVTGAVIGERWAVGASVVVQVTRPRTPCTTFAGFWGVPDLIKRFTARGTPGAYLRVVRAGEVAAGDPIEVVYRPTHGVTIGETFRALNTEPDLLPRLLEVPELPTSIRDRVARRISGGS